MRHTRRILGLAIGTLVLSGTSVSAQFTGDLKLGPPGCEQTGICELLADLRYRDPNGYDWQAAKGLKTDGASIPSWAQPFVGGPFDKAYLKAAVVHDHYCIRQVRTWRETHRAFYYALIALDLPVAKAKLMYYAVYLGGPKWVDLMAGKNCGGQTCINNVDIDGMASIKNSEKLKISRPSEYQSAGFIDELRSVEKLIAEKGDSVELFELESRANEKRPSDMFYKLPNGATFGGGLNLK